MPTPRLNVAAIFLIVTIAGIASCNSSRPSSKRDSAPYPQNHVEIICRPGFAVGFGSSNYTMEEMAFLSRVVLFVNAQDELVRSDGTSLAYPLYIPESARAIIITETGSVSVREPGDTITQIGQIAAWRLPRLQRNRVQTIAETSVIPLSFDEKYLSASVVLTLPPKALAASDGQLSQTSQK